MGKKGKSKNVPLDKAQSTTGKHTKDHKKVILRRSQRIKPIANPPDQKNISASAGIIKKYKNTTAPNKAVKSFQENLTVNIPKAYQFKITMLGIEPEIWRRIQVPEEYHFGELGYALKSAMGWISCHHVHGFMAPNDEGGTDFIRRPDSFVEELNEGVIDEQTVKLADRFKKKGDRVVYSYTFGEGWEHLVELEEIVLRVPNKEYPCILDGKRACPTEDIGSVDQYLAMCEAIRDKKHPEYQEYRDWLKDNGYPRYNPDQFSTRNICFYFCPIYKGKSRAIHHINRQ